MKTVILAGGFGTRLSEETVIKPKPMVEIGDLPILWHIMKIYSHYGHNDFSIALGYKGSYIKEYFSNYMTRSCNLSIDMESKSLQYLNPNKSEKWKIDLIDTGEKTLTGGRLHRLEKHLENEDIFMLTYGDGVANVDINKLIAFHKSHGRVATVTAVRPPARFGALVIQNDIVVDFREKPQIGEGWINGGFFIFNKEFFQYLSGDQCVLEREPLEKLAQKKELMAFQHEGFWHPMDTVRDKDLLNSLWSNGDAPWKCWG